MVSGSLSIKVTKNYFSPHGITTQTAQYFHKKLLNLNKINGSFRSNWIHYQMYSLYELLELFKDLRLQVTYGAEDFNESPIKEESPWMIFVLQKP